MHGLVGQNGAGKSTMVKLLSGAVVPVSGDIVLDGTKVVLRSPADAQKHGVITIHQDPQLFPDMDVARTVLGLSSPLLRSRRTGLVDKRRVRGEALNLLGSLGVDVDPDQLIRSLSLAEQRLVEIAAAMSHRPRFLILDELTASLEQGASARVLELVRRLCAQGTGVCFVSHRLGEVHEYCDVVTVLREGRVVDTVSSPLQESDMVARMLGVESRPSRAAVLHEPGTANEVLLEARLVELPSCGTEVSVEVRTGEVYGVTGALGSGAPDLVRVLGGALKARCELKLAGKRTRNGTPARARKSGICFLSGSRREEGIIPELSVKANLALSSLGAVARCGVVSPRRLSELTERYRQPLDIRMGDSGALISTLSGGNQQKVLVARALASTPKVLCVDEPSQGVDIAAREQIHDLLRSFARGGGAVIVFSSDVEELVSLCDRVAVFRNGVIKAHLEAAEITASHIVLAGVEDDADTDPIGTPDPGRQGGDPR
jgi:ABC-type sugar transport system ATPase subunit